MDARVKPLVWEESLKDRWIGTPDSKLGDLAFWIFRHHDGTLKRATKEGWQFYPTLDAAKAAAQADYEALILAALEPAPDLAEMRNDWDELMAEARAEAAKAMRKFPQPNYVISKIAEEAGEVVKAAIHCAEGRETAENLRGEMKQTLAMLYRLWVEGDQVHGLPPVSAAIAKIKESTHGA